MSTATEKYLNAIDRHLKPLSALERADIVKEIQSSMQEMEQEGLSEQEILKRLGEPKKLAKAYLGDLLTKSRGFSWNRFLIICAFYSLVGVTGLILIPTLAVIAPVFMLCGLLCPVLGIIKLADFLLPVHIPYSEYIMFQFGSVTAGPVPVFFLCILTGILLYLLGYGSWKLLVGYCKKVSSTRRGLSA